MAKEIFDQERPRSAMARRLDDAFAGCDQWTLAPAKPRGNMDVAPWLSSTAQPLRRRARSYEPESRAA